MTTSPWEADEHFSAASKSKHSGIWKLIFAVVALAVAGGGIYVYFFSQSPTGVDVAVEFVNPPPALLGEPFSLTLSAANRSDGVLHNAKLQLLLPEDVYFVGEYSNERIHEEMLGTLGPGSVTQRTVNVVALGQAQSVRRIDGKLVYSTSPEGRVQFEQVARAEVKVGDPALQLSFDVPKQVVNSETFTTKIHYKNASRQEFKNVRLTLRASPLFTFERASLETASRTNDVWNIGVLKGGEEGDLAISGKVMGPEGTFFPLNAVLGADFLGESRELATQTASVGIATSPLSVSVVANGSPDYVAKIGDAMVYTIAVKNNSSITFRELTVSARLSGGLFNYGAVRSQGSLNSLTNTVTWIAANDPNLLSIAPGETRTLTLEAQLKGAFPIARVSDKNYAVKVQVRVESPTVPPDTAVEKTVSLAEVSTKVMGSISLRAKALWRDASWGIINEGVYPPRANQSTQYAIHWQITNSATDAGTVHVEAYLQSGARFVGKAKSNVATIPQYNASTGLISWDIPAVAATKGIVSAPVEAVFQIEATPAITQVGQNILLLGESNLRAQDLFTNARLESRAREVDSGLLEDPTITVTDRRVQP